ncbi:hypothetical protein TRIATDRAFT_266127 [Trichoderma atroviride IMI 206040]|uniref:Fungal STAND N-terminal Goodbye domain-containing protein n=1 Tax=Hypocrea atroviridis (strain ATCC 20476 / IMI 206040) TaxID=452589 RepID=G9P0V0_HYPAI|nr:uncharacterized protein TRIATDRAFT_266127 [Trichoderma atroviride IMI 206040]EHK42417.1 hypothetical protein TRIATDRAFT_266127 [Trichoderma atroviride IMI 206040]
MEGKQYPGESGSLYEFHYKPTKYSIIKGGQVHVALPPIMGLERRETSDKQVTTIAATFIESKAEEIHGGFGGSSEFDPERSQFVPFQPYVYFQTALGINRDEETWDSLCEKITDTKAKYNDSKSGIWHTIWYKMGGYKDTLDGWTALIPDQYGLAVVKTGIAVIFKLAEHSTKRRNLILKTFEGLRDSLTAARHKQESFRSHKNVRECADRLYQAIVDSIEDMILLTSKKDPRFFRFISKPKNNLPPPDAEEILKKVATSSKEFEDAIGLARDQTIENTQAVAYYTGTKITLVHRDVSATMRNTELLSGKIDSYATEMDSRMLELRRFISEASKTQQKLAENAMEQQHNQLDNRNLLLQLIEEMVSESRLFDILFPPDPKLLVQQSNRDLERAFLQRAAIKAPTQGQVQSLLRHHRFLRWLNQHGPDLVLVDANIRLPGLNKLSAVSVFCATFVASIIKVQPSEVVIQFFCGLHDMPRDPLFGPNGLVRSMILQLLMKLINMKILDLNFINDRDYLMALEEHNLHSLCDTLDFLVNQFPPDTTVYCIIDSIWCFDKERFFKDFEFVMQHLHRLVNSKQLIPNFKVLLANPMQSTRRVKGMSIFRNDPSSIITLSPNNLIPLEISSRVIEGYLLRPSTPTPPMRKWEVDSDQDGEGWNTE